MRLKKSYKYIWSLCLLYLFVTVSCCKEEIVIPGTIQDNYGGDFLITNMNTNESIQLKGELSIYMDEMPNLSAESGDCIKVEFIPKEEYKEYIFKTKFVFPEKEYKDSYSVDYTVEGNLNGEYIVSLYAESKTNGSDTIPNTDIIANAAFILEVNAL